MANWADYRKKYEDVETWINDARKPGIITKGDYTKKYGVDTTGWEQDWLSNANEEYGRSARDISEYTQDELAKLHYTRWGKNENRNWEGQGITEGQAENAKDDYFDIKKFETLLNQLEASKGRQQRQKSLEGRRDTFAGGLAQMMSNF